MRLSSSLGDVALFRGAMPFLRELARAAERFPDAFSASAVQVAGGSRSDPGHCSSRRVRLRGNPACPPELATFVPLVAAAEVEALSLYRSEVNPHACLTRSHAYDLLRYERGQRYGLHVDAVAGHPVLAEARLSGVGLCAAAQSGGSLRFPRQAVSLDLEPGDFVLFPAGLTHPHEVSPIEGDLPRLSLAVWYF